MTAIVSCIYHPTTVLFVDDNKRFLDDISLNLKAHMPYQCYQDAKAALSYLLSLNYQNDLSQKILVLDEESERYYLESGIHPIQIKVSKIHEEIYNPARFEQISVVVVDYDMPEINGALFCEKIAHLPLKKIMLTGEADESIAIELFNKGVIDQFIQKGNPSLNKLLLENILGLQKKYFKSLSLPIFKGLLTEPGSCVNDPHFIDLFEEVKSNLSAPSYYLLDTSGSFLFIDERGVPTWLLVKTEQDMQDYVEIAKDAEVPQFILSAIQSRRQIPYWNDFDGYRGAMVGDWENALYPAQSLVLQNGEHCFYAIVKEVKNSPLIQKNIISFKSDQ